MSDFPENIDNDELFVDIELRSDREIRARVRILDAICQRITSEYRLNTGDITSESAQEERFDLLAEVMEPGVSPELAAAEREFLEFPCGEIPVELLEEFSTCQEFLLALAAAFVAPTILPPPPAFASDAVAGNHIQQFVQSANEGNKIETPNEDELEALREYFELWQWRSFIEAEKRSQTAPVPKVEREFEEVLAEVREVGLIDYATGTGLSETLSLATAWSNDDLAKFELAITARLHAINWLCGIGERWDSNQAWL